MTTPEREDLELVPQPVAKGTPRRAKESPWYLPTNQLNLLFMLAAGLVSGPAGFGRKYYADCLGNSPGWIPLFADAVPQSALQQAVVEGGHLRQVIAAIELSSLLGTVQAVGRDGVRKSIELPQGLSGDELALLIPAPLPATWIRSIHFPSKEERAAVEEEASDFSNVPLDAYKRQVSAKLFGRQSLCPWPLEEAAALPSRDRPIYDSASVGGAMALSFALGNRGEATAEATRIFFDPDCRELPQERIRDQAPEPLLGALNRWACLDESLLERDIQGRLLLTILRALSDVNVRGDDDSSSAPPDFHQTVLDCLAVEAGRLAEIGDDKGQSASERLDGLARDLKGVLGLGAHTISELLERHPKPFSRGLLLFFLRDRPEGLLELDSPGLNAMDYVVAAALFAARSGWMGMPAEIRDQPGLREAVAHRMAALAQRQAGSDLNLGPAPERITPLRGLLGTVMSNWSKAQDEAALKLARGMGWQELLSTRISLGKGDYRLQVDGRGAHLLLDGEVKAVTTEIDREALLERLSRTPIPPKLDAEVRTTFDRRR